MSAAADSSPAATTDQCDSAEGDSAAPQLDRSLQPVPTGTVGEICFGGGGEGFLACGYWRNEPLTTEKFVHTEEYGRVYRTGDAGYWQDGQVVVSGRLDRQVKVRGVRIQPEEIEAKVKRFIDSSGSMAVKVGC
jgi:non-ribosomal peptide synthetase component F